MLICLNWLRKEAKSFTKGDVALAACRTERHTETKSARKSDKRRKSTRNYLKLPTGQRWQQSKSKKGNRKSNQICFLLPQERPKNRGVPNDIHPKKKEIPPERSAKKPKRNNSSASAGKTVHVSPLLRDVRKTNHEKPKNKKQSSSHRQTTKRQNQVVIRSDKPNGLILPKQAESVRSTLCQKFRKLCIKNSGRIKPRWFLILLNRTKTALSKQRNGSALRCQKAQDGSTLPLWSAEILLGYWSVPGECSITGCYLLLCPGCRLRVNVGD